MNPTEAEIRRELASIKRANVLSPQEHALLERIVHHTIAGETGQLYQKVMADGLRIASAKQIGVIDAGARQAGRALPAVAERAGGGPHRAAGTRV